MRTVGYSMVLHGTLKYIKVLYKIWFFVQCNMNSKAILYIIFYYLSYNNKNQKFQTVIHEIMKMAKY